MADDQEPYYFDWKRDKEDKEKEKEYGPVTKAFLWLLIVVFVVWPALVILGMLVCGAIWFLVMMLAGRP